MCLSRGCTAKRTPVQLGLAPSLADAFGQRQSSWSRVEDFPLLTDGFTTHAPGKAGHTWGMTDETTDPAKKPSADPVEDVELDTYDLDGDGKISMIESERARLGLVDARLEEIAEEGGIKGKIADAAHHVIDKLDND